MVRKSEWYNYDIGRILECFFKYVKEGYGYKIVVIGLC